ncbi:DUF1624 domain-containing protein [Methylocystis heyeri]|uniref:DUF1624 domain-containing protein n=1 Tax=Methylocystis heyeri TaxID=391905 RepID=A0A6B8KC40_9HYPH|nr:heparan-alpha-glucosaminide N-acetyltransferase domain-containing protein [Methylocystis heyeri]QGM45227.1 DUF1624 domain-containing protein [Methylocystis heyeri]
MSDVGSNDNRLPGIDRLRGLVMVLMALDHMRDFFDADALRFRPTDLTHTYRFLFFTRFVTHFCAPTFALLAGVGAYLHGARLGDPRRLSFFLASRGLWLIFLDVFVISPAWAPGSGRVELGTLYAIGCGLLALSALSRLPARIVFAVGAAIVLGHNLLDGIHAEALGAWGPWWRMLHEPGPLPLGASGSVLYPALPWIGVVALGYGIGPLFHQPIRRRDRVLCGAGLASLAAFVLLRSGNFYGDPASWTFQHEPMFTLLSFLNVTKYPPSLLYLLITLGCAALALPALERLPGRAGGALATFGRTPLFFYVLHIYIGLAAAMALALAQGYSFADIAKYLNIGEPPPEFGAGLGGAYVAWALVVAALYPPCRWFADLKRRRKDWQWLSYL